MRSAQSALKLPYDDNENVGELIVIVEETGFLFQWTWTESSSCYSLQPSFWQWHKFSLLNTTMANVLNVAKVT